MRPTTFLVTNLAEFKRALAVQGACVALVEVGTPEGEKMQPFQERAIGKVKRVSRLQTKSVAFAPYEGQTYDDGRPVTADQWLDFGPASRWTFAVQSGFSLVTLHDGEWSRTYRVGVNA